jgi:N-acetylmuramoyl-L-alanine amidase
MTQEAWEIALLALLLWREARGESFETQRIVAWSVRNRVLRPGYWGWGRDWCSVMAHPLAYSSLTAARDPNLIEWPPALEPHWIACCDAAAQVHGGGMGDAAQGATHYYDVSLDGAPPAWAAKMVKVLDSGRFHFYKPNET